MSIPINLALKNGRSPDVMKFKYLHYLHRDKTLNTVSSRLRYLTAQRISEKSRPLGQRLYALQRTDVLNTTCGFIKLINQIIEASTIGYPFPAGFARSPIVPTVIIGLIKDVVFQGVIVINTN